MRGMCHLLFFLSIAWLASGAAFAQDTGAKSSGNWETVSIWTGGTVPNSSNNVYIGSNNYPTGAATNADVTLTANESANNVYLGDGSGTQGVLNLGSNTLTIGGGLFMGQSGGTALLTEVLGSFSAQNAYVSGNALTFGVNDAVSYLQLNQGALATTSATGNITGNIDDLSNST
jgi:hypothetical protein